MSEKVLIVEDEANILESLLFLLRRDGFEVDSVTDGELALARAEVFAPDVMILDVMLPNRSGFDILSDIRRHDTLNKVPVMILTAKGQARDRDMADQLGADMFMTKPFSNADIVAAARQLAGRVTS